MCIWQCWQSSQHTHFQWSLRFCLQTFSNHLVRLSGIVWRVQNHSVHVWHLSVSFLEDYLHFPSTFLKMAMYRSISDDIIKISLRCKNLQIYRCSYHLHSFTIVCVQSSARGFAFAISCSFFFEMFLSGRKAPAVPEIHGSNERRESQAGPVEGKSC